MKITIARFIGRSLLLAFLLSWGAPYVSWTVTTDHIGALERAVLLFAFGLVALMALRYWLTGRLVLPRDRVDG